jgi:hypothetical protein
MKSTALILAGAIALSLLTLTAHARLGETRAQIEERYGPPIEQSQEFPDCWIYRKNGITIHVAFIDGKSAMERFYGMDSYHNGLNTERNWANGNDITRADTDTTCAGVTALCVFKRHTRLNLILNPQFQSQARHILKCERRRSMLNTRCQNINQEKLPSKRWFRLTKEKLTAFSQ